MTEDKIRITHEIFNDLKYALTVEELSAFLEKMYELKRLDDGQFSYSSECLCGHIFWYLDEIEREKNRAEFLKRYPSAV